MGSGVSVEVTNKAKELINIVSSSSSSDRADALEQLGDLCDNDDCKKPLASPEAGLLPLLVAIIKDTDTAGYLSCRTRAVRCINSISLGDDIEMILVEEPDLITSFHSIISNDSNSNDLRVACANTICNIGITNNDLAIILIKEPGLLASLHDTAKNETNDIEIRQNCVRVLANICRSVSKDDVSILIANNIHTLAVDLLRPLDKG